LNSFTVDELIEGAVTPSGQLHQIP